MKKKAVVLLSPFLIMAINVVVAILFGRMIGKWAFVPIILIEWCLFVFFILRFGGTASIRDWLRPPTGSFGWNILALVVGLIPLPLFLMHFDTLSTGPIVLSWLLLALINPWIEEFYWRGLLMKYTDQWPRVVSVLFTSLVFAGSHAVFGINSALNHGFTVIISTFVMGVVWAVVFLKTGSLRWTIGAHFLVDFLGLSAAAFLDLWEAP